jgi:hypothetical protein
MSDTPQAPGWWQASDGKWYPPQSDQSAPPPPPGIQPAYQPPPKKKGGCLKVGLIVAVVGVALLIGLIALIGTAADEAEDNLEERQAEIDDDVELVSCSTNSAGFMVAEIRITNNSSERSNYGVDVTFEAANGDQIDTGFAAVSALEPGQSTTQEAGSLTEPPGEFECRVADVTRFTDE